MFRIPENTPIRRQPDSMPDIRDLQAIWKEILKYRDTEVWEQAIKQMGPASARLIEQCGNGELTLDTIARLAFPEPSAVAVRHKLDLAVGAVAAHAVLGRFGRCVETIHSERPMHKQPNDLLQAMVNARQKEGGDFLQLITREAAERLAMDSNTIRERVAYVLAEMKEVFDSLVEEDRLGSSVEKDGV